jgi:pyridoxamine 5'-phosphate oxidase
VNEAAPLIDPTRIPEWAWSSLEQGADDPRHSMHLLTLATTGLDGRPSARLMTNRGADRVSGRLWFYTRTDVPKAADLRASPWVCVVGYDAAAGVQLRVFGQATVHTGDQLSEHHWAHVASVAKWLYEAAAEAGPSPVGVDPRFPMNRAKLTTGISRRSRARFGVIEVKAQTIDWLQAGEQTQLRAVMHAEDRWAARVLERDADG